MKSIKDFLVFLESVLRCKVSLPAHKRHHVCLNGCTSEGEGIDGQYTTTDQTDTYLFSPTWTDFIPLVSCGSRARVPTKSSYPSDYLFIGNTVEQASRWPQQKTKACNICCKTICSRSRCSFRRFQMQLLGSMLWKSNWTRCRPSG
jgi:hypothetical protein